MAAPTITTSAAGFASVNGGTPNVPSHQIDDILVCILETNAQAPGNNPPTGWTECEGSPLTDGSAGVAGAIRLSAFWKRAASTSETGPDVGDSGDHQIARCFGVRGCRNTGSPIHKFATQTSGGVAGTSWTGPGLTTALADCLLVFLGVNGTDTATTQWSALSNPDITGTTLNNINAATGNGGGYLIFYGTAAAAQAYGNTTATLATSSLWAGLTLAFASLAEPAGSGSQAAVILTEGY